MHAPRVRKILRELHSQAPAARARGRRALRTALPKAETSSKSISFQRYFRPIIGCQQLARPHPSLDLPAL